MELSKEVLDYFPQYAEEFDKPCACGQCPKAQKQTRVSEIKTQKMYTFTYEDLYAHVASYECGLCKTQHNMCLWSKSLIPCNIPWVGESSS